MALVKCPDCGKDISDSAPSCPHCGRPRTNESSPQKEEFKPKHVGCLIVLGLFGLISLWVVCSNMFSKSGTPPTTPGKAKSGAPGDGATQLPPPVTNQLELIAFHWSEEYGYASVEGQVRNISGESIENVEVVATFYDAKGGFITSESSLIDYNPILPGQTSPFKAIATWNPAMKKAGVEFKFLMGGTIPTKTSSKK